MNIIRIYPKRREKSRYSDGAILTISEKLRDILDLMRTEPYAPITGTPKTLQEAIQNGLAASIGKPNRAQVIEKHVQDFLAQRFGAMMLRTQKSTTSVLKGLFEEIRGSE